MVSAFAVLLVAVRVQQFVQLARILKLHFEHPATREGIAVDLREHHRFNALAFVWYKGNGFSSQCQLQ